MISQPKNVFLFTGMSGIFIEQHLEKFSNGIREFRLRKIPKPLIIKLDAEVENAYYDANPNVRRSKQIWKNTILTRSYPVLKKLWHKAFSNVLDTILKCNEEDPDRLIFLNFHSCYFHKKTEEYVSIIDLDLIKKLNPVMTISLIDDIFDIHHRLTMPGGIFHDETLTSNTTMILRLIRLLDWRAKEIMITKIISSHLKINNFIFSVKHPFETLFNLVYQQLPKVYLSHPITEVRRLEKKGLSSEVDAIMSDITQISVLLTGIYTTFLPTTIDEYRIRFNVDGSKVPNYIPALSKRWEEKLYKSSSDIIYIDSGFDDTNSLWHNIDSIPVDINESISHLLEALATYISHQVTTRDFSMVEQSDILIIYRPIFNGNASGGVRQEFNYYLRLKNDTDKDKECYIYSPKEDLEKYYIKQFELKIKDELKMENLYSTNLTEIQMNDSEKEILLRSINDKNLLLDVFDSILDSNSIEINRKISISPLSDNQIDIYKNEVIDDLIGNYQSILEYQKKATYYEDNVVSIDTFVQKIDNLHNIK